MHIFYKSLSLFFFIYFSNLSTFATSINIKVEAHLLQNSIVKNAIDDIQNLLSQVDAVEVFVNSKKSIDYILDIDTANNFNQNISVQDKSIRNEFVWNKANKRFVLTGNSYKAIADGLYALLQEQLGFKFYHCKRSIVPTNFVDSLYNMQTMSGTQVFNKNGFHLHTMHPIELTEFLLDATKPNALNEVKLYIDWLARNGQNYFEFNLLESIDKNSWIEHAKAITDYAHQRGISCGIDISIHMIQQKAFKLYSGFFNTENKIIKNIHWLSKAGFDIWNIELSTTEFSQQNYDNLLQKIKLIKSELQARNISMMSRSHVVKANKMVSNQKNNLYNLLDTSHGLMIHTVMFYSMLDKYAPVYENENLLHMRDLLLQEKDKREVWYYPESAYWITFDNAVPMFLLPYLQARLDDINFCEQEKIIGHLTFSSGWEWGYWLIDWSIARWSWNISINKNKKEKSPLQFLKELVVDNSVFQYIEKSAQLQQIYIKDSTLIQVLTAQTITDEIGGKLNLELAPRPKYSYKYIRNKAKYEEVKQIEQKYINVLDKYISEQNALKIPKTENALIQEILDGIQITKIRAQHRNNLLKYITQFRLNKIKEKNLPIKIYLDSAKIFRLTALEIVQSREQQYRYSVADLSYPRNSKTAYEFGYLHPTHNLHFWEREELQAQKNKYKFWYRNIWDVLKIIGLKN